MALWNQIGPFVFLDLIGGVLLPQQGAELLERPGVDGAGLKLIGKRSAPFTLHSRVDALTVGDAHDAAANYQALANDGFSYGLAQHGVDFGIYGVEFLVLKVANARVGGRMLVMGGLHPPSLGWIEAEWTLLAVRINV